jgi:hypothetical protein
VTRTTLDLDPIVLQRLKDRSRREGKSMGKLASELLARELTEKDVPFAAPPLNWPVQRMGALVDLKDKDGLYRILDEDSDQ